MNKKQTMDSKKSKPWQQILEQESSDNDELTKLLNTKPILTKAEKQLDKKLDQIIDRKLDRDDLQKVASKDDVKKLDDVFKQHDQAIQKAMKDQNSRIADSLKTSHDSGFQEGIVERVDALSQKYLGLEENINIREQELNQKSQTYIAKLVDLNEVGKYLQSYVHTINTQYVPVEQALISAMKRGITIHTDDVAKDILQVFQKATGKSVEQVINDSTYQELERSRHDANQAKLDAVLCARVAKDSLLKCSNLISTFMRYFMFLCLSFLLLIVAVSLTPGLWKVVWGIVAIMISLGTLAIYNYLGKRYFDES